MSRSHSATSSLATIGSRLAVNRAVMKQKAERLLNVAGAAVLRHTTGTGDNNSNADSLSLSSLLGKVCYL